jgi:hypothetical protein
MTTRRRRWYKIPGPLHHRIASLADKYPAWTPKQIYDYLDARNEQGNFKHHVIAEYGLPEIRTVERIVKESRPPDPSGAWVPTKWAGEDVALVLEVLKLLCQTGEAYWPTRAEAERLLWVRRAAPTMDLELAWRFARRYLLYEVQQVSTERLDWYLTFRPWEGTENKDAYFKAVPQEQRAMYPVEATASITVRGSINATGVVNKQDEVIEGEE